MQILNISQYELAESASIPSNHQSNNFTKLEPTHAEINALVSISNLVSVQINHYQYLFLMRLLEEIAELTTFLSLDSSRILKQDTTGSMLIAGVVPQVNKNYFIYMIILLIYFLIEFIIIYGIFR